MGAYLVMLNVTRKSMNRKLAWNLTVVVALSSLLNASPLSEWKATSGHSVHAKLIELQGREVTMELENQKTITVPLKTFVAEDKQKILAHFGMEGKLLLAAGSRAEPLTDCAFPMGVVHGPVVTGESSYYVYVPSSLKKDRLAPILFYTNAAGGDTKHHLEFLAETGELFGCILAYSIDSSNANGWQNNIKDVERCMDDLFSKLPIDKGRIHYTGNSGGGNTACLNSSINKAWGLMPNVAMLPEGLGVNTQVIYATGGSTDHNRFLTAHAADLYGKDGFHRMSKNGHGDAPVDHRCDGLFWMTCKYFAKHGKKHPDEVKDFERNMLEWIHGLISSDSHRAYANAVILRDVYGLDGENLLALDEMLTSLSQNKDNILYQEALIALDSFSEKHLAPIGKKGWTPQGHAGVEGEADAKILKSTYGHIPELAPIIEGLFQPAPRMK